MISKSARLTQDASQNWDILYSKYLGQHASCAFDLDPLLLCMSRTWDGERPG